MTMLQKNGCSQVDTKARHRNAVARAMRMKAEEEISLFLKI